MGYVADITQAPALVGLRSGLFASALGSGVLLRPVRFATDAAEAVALQSGKLDAAYASPDTILTELMAPGARPIRIISGASATDPELVVRRGIADPSGLRGRTIAVPESGGVQEVELRAWLSGQHLLSSAAGEAEVSVIAPGPDLVAAFKSGTIAGAVVTAPWDIELAAGGGHVLDPDLAVPSGVRPAAANLVVTKAFLDAHGSAVLSLLRGQVQVTDYLHTNLLQSNVTVTAGLAAAGQRLPASVVGSSLIQVTFTEDPVASSLAAQARQAGAAGSHVPAVNLAILYDLAPLDLILRAAGEPPVYS